jgi:hypothetical protein
VAKAMQKTIASEIVKLKQSGEPAAGTEELIFTGHSAGGAIAQLFYAMCASPEHNLSGILAGESNDLRTHVLGNVAHAQQDSPRSIASPLAVPLCRHVPSRDPTRGFSRVGCSST